MKYKLITKNNYNEKIASGSVSLLPSVDGALRRSMVQANTIVIRVPVPLLGQSREL